MQRIYSHIALVAFGLSVCASTILSLTTLCQPVLQTIDIKNTAINLPEST